MSVEMTQRDENEKLLKIGNLEYDRKQEMNIKENNAGEMNSPNVLIVPG